MDLSPAAIREGGLYFAVAVLILVVLYQARENRALWERHVVKAENFAVHALELATALKALTERVARLEAILERIFEAVQKRRGG